MLRGIASLLLYLDAGRPPEGSPWKAPAHRPPATPRGLELARREAEEIAPLYAELLERSDELGAATDRLRLLVSLATLRPGRDDREAPR